MILGVNGIRLLGKRSGVGRAIEAILQCFDELEHPFSEIKVYTPAPLDNTVKLPGVAHNVVLPSRLPPSLWEQLVLLRAHGNKDILFCPSYVVPLLARCPTLLIHHGSYEGYRDIAELFHWWSRLKARVTYHLSARLATQVVTVSEHSKHDMVRFYGVAADAIEVIPEGVDTALFRPLRDNAQLTDWRHTVLGADVPFLLYVGKPSRRRNLPNLLQAFKALKHNHNIPHKLLLIGTALPGMSLVEEINATDLTDEVVLTDYSGHDKLVLAYNACDIMIYPSSYEGFGMPVLEAMACGTPVIALNNTAFPEFAGGVASLLANAEVETLSNAIAELLFDQDKRQSMMHLGPQRAAAYDWHNIAQRHIKLLSNLLPQPVQTIKP